MNHSAAIQGGRQYPDNQASSLYRGGEVKSVVKPQLGIGGMLKWDIWNGRSKRYEKIRWQRTSNVYCEKISKKNVNS